MPYFLLLLHPLFLPLFFLHPALPPYTTCTACPDLRVQTKDSHVWAKLDLQLSLADSRRPGLSEAEVRTEAHPRKEQETAAHLPNRPSQQPQSRYKAPGAQAWDARRRQEWLDRRQTTVLDQSASQPEKEHVDLEQTTPNVRQQQEP